MKQNSLATSDFDRRRASVRRTALWLGAVALTIFVCFIFAAVRK